MKRSLSKFFWYSIFHFSLISLSRGHLTQYIINSPFCSTYEKVQCILLIILKSEFANIWKEIIRNSCWHGITYQIQYWLCNTLCIIWQIPWYTMKLFYNIWHQMKHKIEGHKYRSWRVLLMGVFFYFLFFILLPFIPHSFRHTGQMITNVLSQFLNWLKLFSFPFYHHFTYVI